MLRIQAMDHIVLIVADVEASMAWYRDRLGLEPVRYDEWRSGRAPFPSLRVDASTIIDLIPGTRDGRNLDHLCFALEPVDLQQVVDGGEFDVVAGPSPRFGARGVGTSIYVRDPDANIVELRHYGGSDQ